MPRKYSPASPARDGGASGTQCVCPVCYGKHLTENEATKFVSSPLSLSCFPKFRASHLAIVKRTVLIDQVQRNSVRFKGAIESTFAGELHL